jgi:hypothetical protein
VTTRTWIHSLSGRNASRALQRSRTAWARRLTLEILEPRVVLSTFIVDSTGDSDVGLGGASGGSGDIRWCIDQANANHQANTIVFDSTVFSTAQTITLSGSALALTDTAGTQAITGPAAGVTIDADGLSRVFQVNSSVTASLSGLTITGGSTGASGGGVDNHGTLTLTGCTVSGNSAVEGGGIVNYGSLTLTDSTVSGNSAV